MELSSTLTTGGDLASANSSTSSLQQLGEDYSRFLTLLTAQISNQDPLKPMDSTQFVSQLAQLSQVEQAVKSNDQLELLGDKIAALTAVAGVDMIGREVTIASNLVEHTAGNNKSFFRLPVAANDVVATIRDPLDRVIRTLNGLSGEADVDIPLNWDGRDEIGGVTLDGNYTVSINATDREGNTLPVYVYRKANVQEVLFDQGKLYYDVTGDEVINAQSVFAIR